MSFSITSLVLSLSISACPFNERHLVNHKSLAHKEQESGPSGAIHDECGVTRETAKSGYRISAIALRLSHCGYRIPRMSTTACLPRACLPPS